MDHSTVCFICRPMLPIDVAQLAKLLPDLLPGTWSTEFLSNAVHSSHEFLVYIHKHLTTETVIGFAEFYRVLDECNLLNFAIAKQWQKQGLGKVFMHDLIIAVRLRGCARCLLEVRRSNIAAISLYAKTGFVLDGVRPDYYPALWAGEKTEDALLYSLLLSSFSALG